LRRWHFLEQSNFLEILRRDGKRNGVANGLMESIIRAIYEQERLVLIRPLIKIVPQFVMNRYKILVANLDAHLDPDIVFVVDVPRAGVADDIAIFRLHKE